MSETADHQGKGAIVPRNIDFELGEDVSYDWHDKGPGVSNFFNVLSLLFPEGEKFFVISARHYASRVTDETERKDLRGFMTQEMLHTREHVEYNNMLTRYGVKTDAMNEELKRILVGFKKILPPSFALAATASLEHWTAIQAEHVLDDKRVVGNAHPKMTALWSWHAIEESEHKAVCFDLLKKVTGGGLWFYTLRNLVHIFTIPPLFAIIVLWYLRVSNQTGQLWNVKEHLRLVWNLFVTPGIASRIALPWLRYFKPGFHPWDNDNSHHIRQWDEEAPDRSHPPARFNPA